EAGKLDRIVDSIGAGDSFDAGYIDALLDGNDPGSCLANATKVATRTLASVGGQFNNPGTNPR
ncbi:hypothetical protein GF325_05520, partial [Candidatus Bathyarchaeota archaeon]|nr:hypothetical protein [Candidatus Bathyarchaeota archaeon]